MTMYQKILAKNINWDFDNEEKRARYLKSRDVCHLASFLSKNIIVLELLVLLVLLIGILNSYIAENNNYINLIYIGVPISILTIACSLKVSSLKDIIQNVCLYNQKVITFKDWWDIRKYSRSLYKQIRTDECKRLCYDTVYSIANVIRNPEIKIVWVSLEDYTLNQRVGHAVLKKGNYIYDSNIRRTFNIQEYFENNKVELYREFELADYLENRYEMDTLIFEDFEAWCIYHNAIASV